jgi:hypothetical protein
MVKVNKAWPAKKKPKDRVLNLDQIRWYYIACVSSSWHRRAIYKTCIIEWIEDQLLLGIVKTLSLFSLTEITFVVASIYHHPLWHLLSNQHHEWIELSKYDDVVLFNFLHPLFQIISHFNFFWFIHLDMYLDMAGPEGGRMGQSPWAPSQIYTIVFNYPYNCLVKAPQRSLRRC